MTSPAAELLTDGGVSTLTMTHIGISWLQAQNQQLSRLNPYSDGICLQGQCAKISANKGNVLLGNVHGIRHHCGGGFCFFLQVVITPKSTMCESVEVWFS